MIINKQAKSVIVNLSFASLLYLFFGTMIELFSSHIVYFRNRKIEHLSLSKRYILINASSHCLALMLNLDEMRLTNNMKHLTYSFIPMVLSINVQVSAQKLSFVLA